MKKKTWLKIAFCAAILVQWTIAIKMIWSSEKTLKEGQSYKFEIDPFDPVDPIRGYYMDLQFSEDRVTVDSASGWFEVPKLYVEIVENERGYAALGKVHQKVPSHTSEYLTLPHSGYVINQGTVVFQLEYPFRKYYVQEDKAPALEKYLWTNRSAGIRLHADVYVRNGRGVLREVYANERPILELVE